MTPRLKKVVCALLVWALLIAVVPNIGSYASGGVIGVTIDGKALVLSQPPISESGRILVPMRAIFEGLGAQVHWDPKTQTATGIKGDITVVLAVGSTSALVNNKTITLDVPAKIVNSSTLVPARFVAESLGASVVWDGANNLVKIISNEGTVMLDEESIMDYISYFDMIINEINYSAQVYGEISNAFAMGYDVLDDLAELIEINEEIYIDFTNRKTIRQFAKSQSMMIDVIRIYGQILELTEEIMLGVMAGVADDDLEDEAYELMTLADGFLIQFTGAVECFIEEVDAIE